MKTRALLAVLILAASAAAQARSVGRTFRIEERFELNKDGTVILDNVIGDIEVTGTDDVAVSVDVLKTVVATDEEGIEEGRFLTELVVGGDAANRVLRTLMGGPRNKQWSSSVYWRVKVPRKAHVRISSTSSNHIKVTGIRGNAYVKNFNGTIVFENDSGLVTGDSVNGSIVFTAPAILAETRLTSVNGHVTVRVNQDADLRWIAETIGGDIRTNLPVRGMLAGPSFRGSVNAPGGPLLMTATLTGNVHLLGNGLGSDLIRSVRSIEKILIPPEQINQAVGGIRRGVVNGSVTYNTQSGDVVITEVRGRALLSTNAGRVELGSVFGDANVKSSGGSLQLGEILGSLKASTNAGDVFVEAARRGGVIETTGGTIRLLYTGGPTRLVSGGGDIVVRQAAGPVEAETHSGDITIGVDRSSRRQKIDASTDKGNVVINIGPQFGADFDLTVITSDPAAHTIQADFPGLSISRDEVDGKTRIRATGRINGGGDRVTAQATDGSIRVMSTPVGPTVLGR